MALRVLIVDDEPTIARSLERSLPGAWIVDSETNGERALERLLEEDWDVVLLDLMIPHISGMVIFDELTKKKPALCSNVIFISGGKYIPAVEVFMEKLPHHTLLEKPFHAQEVIEAVLKLVQRNGLNGHGH